MIDLNFPNAILEERDFYGRQEDLATIRSTLLARQRCPIFVIGERRIGKTSLQNIAIKQVLSHESSRFRSYKIQPRGIDTYSQFASAILRQLAPGLDSANAGPLPQLPQTITTIEDFEYALRNILAREECEIIICVDEFDLIVHKLIHDRPTLIGMLYHLIEETGLPIYFFFTMTSLTNELKVDFSSPLVSTAQVIKLPPLSFNEMCELTEHVTSNYWGWPPQIMEELFRLTGGHPYITKLILSCLPVRSTPGLQPVTLDLLASAVQKAIRHPQANYALTDIFTEHFSDDQKALMLFLAQHDSPVFISDLFEAGAEWVAQARELDDRYYVAISDEDQVDFRIPFMREWMKKWKDFEVKCRDYSRLSSIFAKPEIEVDDFMGVVRVKGQEIHLSSQEYKIIRCLAEKTEQIVTRDELMEAAWDSLKGVSDETIDEAVYRLRRKRIHDQGQYIETKFGKGFILHKAVLIKNKADNKN